MLHVRPSISTRTSAFCWSTVTASSSARTASGRRLYRSKSKCTSSKVICATTGRVTWMFTVSLAVLPSVGQVTVTRTGTVPSWFGAVHGVDWPLRLVKVPVGALHSYVTEQPFESVATALTVEVLPTSTVQGSQVARTDRSCGRAAATGGGGGGGGGGAT